MVRQSLIAGCIVGMFAGEAFAAEVSKASWTFRGKIRMDATQSKTETKAGDAPKTSTSSSEILMNNVEMKLIGEQGSDRIDLAYFLHNNTLDVGTLTHKFSDQFSLVAGKMYLMMQSWEWDYSPTDVYVWSLASSYTPLESGTGVQANIAMGDHSLSFQVQEGLGSIVNEDGIEVKFRKSGGLSSAIQYRGDINKMIRPLVTYSVLRTTSSTGYDGKNYGNGYHTHMGIGLQVAAGAATIDAELDTVKVHKYKDDASQTNKDRDIQSAILSAKYAFGNVTPFVKFISDSSKTGMSQAQIDAGAEGDLSGTHVGLGAEYQLDASCRLHAVYDSNATSKKIADGKTEKVNTTGFNFGVTASM